jgi:hypothetical protein
MPMYATAESKGAAQRPRPNLSRSLCPDERSDARFEPPLVGGKRLHALGQLVGGHRVLGVGRAEGGLLPGAVARELVAAARRRPQRVLQPVWRARPKPKPTTTFVLQSFSHLTDSQLQSTYKPCSDPTVHAATEGTL